MEVNEAAFAYEKRKYSVEEYLELEDASEEKHEYYQGEIYAMSGAKLPHIFVEGNVFKALAIGLDDKPCQPFNGNMRVYIEEIESFFYPDISVVCGEPVTRNDDQINVINPTVIIEVLSPSTRNFDQKQKFVNYKYIPTLKEFILIEPGSIKIEAYCKNKAGHWDKKVYDSIDETLTLTSIGISLPLQEIYKRTKLINLTSR